MKQKISNKLKYCPKCKKVKSKKYFYRCKQKSDEFNSYCIKCTRQYSKNWIKNNKEIKKEYDKKYFKSKKGNLSHWEYSLKYKYNLTLKNYFIILKKQNKCCAICKSSNPGSNNKRFCVDHDHSCCPGKTSCGKCIRGLLCHFCNIKLGFFEKNIPFFTVNLFKYVNISIDNRPLLV